MSQTKANEALDTIYNVYVAQLIAAVALNSVATLVLLVVGLASFFLVRRQNDPARVCFAWMKTAFVLLTVSTILQIPTLALVLPSIRQAISDPEFRFAPLEAASRLEHASWFLRAAARLAILLTLVEFGLGIRLCLARRKQGDASGGLMTRAIRWSVVAFAVVCAALAIAYLVLQNLYLTGLYDNWARGGNPRWISEDGVVLLWNTRRIQGAFDIVLFCLSLFVVGLAVVVAMPARKEGMKQASTLYVVACSMWLLSNTWWLASQLRWLLQVDYDSRKVPIFVEVLKNVLGVWPLVVLLVLVLVIGRKKDGGLWSDKQNSTPKHGDA